VFVGHIVTIIQITNQVTENCTLGKQLHEAVCYLKNLFIT